MEHALWVVRTYTFKCGAVSGTSVSPSKIQNCLMSDRDNDYTF